VRRWTVGVAIVRENNPTLGNLLSDFDFNQQPRAPLVLDPNPPRGPAASI
jgi:hypothetical protein